MTDYMLQVSEDEALVLNEYFNRFDNTGDLSFEHAAEYLALQRLSAQLDKTTSAPFKPNFAELLASARTRIATRFQGEVPCLLKKSET